VLYELLIKCPAKINLTLGIIGKRADGYHELETIMQSISLADRLYFSTRPTGIELVTDNLGLSVGEDNLIYRVAVLLNEQFGKNRGAYINLEKRIPIAAGLAGGSTDAAGALRGLNLLWELGMSSEVMEDLGGRLGSDIPFCLQGGAALARGRGEQLTPLQVKHGWWTVLVKPPIEVSTAEVYKSFCIQRVKKQPNTTAMIGALKNADLRGVADNLVNVLETVTINSYPLIGELKAEMIERGALGALMSGSGPTVFGLVEGYEEAVNLADAFRDRFTEVFVACSLPPLERL
jgi:4-diphosphocytidyl-2-C-methyl-D-erythritol kinase